MEHESEHDGATGRHSKHILNRIDPKGKAQKKVCPLPASTVERFRQNDIVGWLL
jgi:hypothetical protein